MKPLEMTEQEAAAFAKRMAGSFVDHAGEMLSRAQGFNFEQHQITSDVFWQLVDYMGQEMVWDNEKLQEVSAAEYYGDALPWLSIFGLENMLAQSMLRMRKSSGENQQLCGSIKARYKAAAGPESLPSDQKETLENFLRQQKKEDGSLLVDPRHSITMYDWDTLAEQFMTVHNLGDEDYGVVCYYLAETLSEMVTTTAKEDLVFYDIQRLGIRTSRQLVESRMSRDEAFEVLVRLLHKQPELLTDLLKHTLRAGFDFPDEQLAGVAAQGLPDLMGQTLLTTQEYVAAQPILALLPELSDDDWGAIRGLLPALRSDSEQEGELHPQIDELRMALRDPKVSLGFMTAALSDRSKVLIEKALHALLEGKWVDDELDPMTDLSGG